MSAYNASNTNNNKAMQPFANIRVLDLTHIIAGPFATYQLAVLGADVIKIEPVDLEDALRQDGGDTSQCAIGLGSSYVAQGANKRAIALNLKQPEGQAILRKLIATADILVENYRTGALTSLGFGYNDCKKIKPNLIYCSITGFGQTGPLSTRTAYDNVIQAMSGLMATTGWAQEKTAANLTASDTVGPPNIPPERSSAAAKHTDEHISEDKSQSISKLMQQADDSFTFSLKDEDIPTTKEEADDHLHAQQLRSKITGANIIKPKPLSRWSKWRESRKHKKTPASVKRAPRVPVINDNEDTLLNQRATPGQNFSNNEVDLKENFAINNNESTENEPIIGEHKPDQKSAASLETDDQLSANKPPTHPEQIQGNTQAPSQKTNQIADPPVGHRGGLKVGPPVLDYGTGTQAAFAIAAALYQRSNTGKGQYIDVAMLDAAIMLSATNFTTLQASGTAPAPSSNHSTTHAGYGCFDTLDDQQIMIGAYSADQCSRLWQELGNEAHAKKMSQLKMHEMQTYLDADKARLATIISTATADEWETRLNKIKVPAARVRSVAEAMHHPQVKKRQVLQKIEVGDKIMSLPTAAFQFGTDDENNGPKLHSGPPKFGQHSVELLQELGYTEKDIALLQKQNVVRCTKQ